MRVGLYVCVCVFFLSPDLLFVGHRKMCLSVCSFGCTSDIFLFLFLPFDFSVSRFYLYIHSFSTHSVFCVVCLYLYADLSICLCIYLPFCLSVSSALPPPSSAVYLFYGGLGTSSILSSKSRQLLVGRPLATAPDAAWIALLCL